jgi:hypothetical protein
VRFVTFLCLCSAVACAPAAPPLAHAQPSAEALARAVLDAVELGDETTLRAVALSEEEFREYVWPELPASRPERNLPLSYVWSDLHQKSERSLRTTLAEYGGWHYTLIGLRFDAETTDYVAFKVHRQAVFRVSRGPDTREVRVCGSMIEMNGAWKVFSYVIDD